MQQQQYSVRITLDVDAIDERGHRMGSGDGLRVNDQLTVKASTFMEIAEVLAQFHDLADRIRERQAAREVMADQETLP